MSTVLVFTKCLIRLHYIRIKLFVVKKLEGPLTNMVICVQWSELVVFTLSGPLSLNVAVEYAFVDFKPYS